MKIPENRTERAVSQAASRWLLCGRRCRGHVRPMRVRQRAALPCTHAAADDHADEGIDAGGVALLRLGFAVHTTWTTNSKEQVEGAVVVGSRGWLRRKCLYRNQADNRLVLPCQRVPAAAMRSKCCG